MFLFLDPENIFNLIERGKVRLSEFKNRLYLSAKIILYVANEITLIGPTTEVMLPTDTICFPFIKD